MGKGGTRLLRNHEKLADKLHKEIDIVNLAYVQRTVDFLAMLMLKKNKAGSSKKVAQTS